MAEPLDDSPLIRFLGALRHRRVVRVAIVYAVAGWVMIEVASTILPGLNLPAWTVTLVIALVVLGFPIAVIMGWLFDNGARSQQPMPAPAQASDPSTVAPRMSRPDTAMPSAAVAAPPRPVDEDRRTIAVLPFVNMSGEADNEYFSDGISEEILNLLAKLPQLKVASRTSSFTFKNKEVGIPMVARELGVGTVLEGSVRRAGDRVRITAQLIEAHSDSHLWSETYDREMKDVFAIQDDIAHSIVKALQVTLTPRERRAIQFVATSDAEAYDYYLRGRSYMKSMARHDYHHAISMFEQAIHLDGQYALAYAGMADAYANLYRYVEATQENADKAVRASEQAVALDRDSGEAHASRGLALFINERYDEAESEFEVATASDPNLFEAWLFYGQACSSQGNHEKAARLYARAIQINPDDYEAPIFLAQTYASLGRRQEEMRTRVGVLGTLEHHLRMNPHDTRALYMDAQMLYFVGETERAMAQAERALEQGRDEPVVLYNIACLYTRRGDLDQALDLLERAVTLGWGDRAWMEHDSDLDPLHDNPRFTALLKRVH